MRALQYIHFSIEHSAVLRVFFFGLVYWLYFTVLSQCYVEMPIFVSKMYAFHLGFHHRLSESNQMENTENLWVDFFFSSSASFFHFFQNRHRRHLILFFYLTLCYVCSLKSYSHQINLYAVAV